VTSFFGIKGAFLAFFSKRQDESAPFLVENTCSLQPALKSAHPAFNISAIFYDNWLIQLRMFLLARNAVDHPKYDFVKA